MVKIVDSLHNNLELNIKGVCYIWIVPLYNQIKGWYNYISYTKIFEIVLWLLCQMINILQWDIGMLCT